MSRYFGDPTAALVAALLPWQAAPTPSSLKTGESTNSWQNSPWGQGCTVITALLLFVSPLQGMALAARDTAPAGMCQPSQGHSMARGSEGTFLLQHPAPDRAHTA